MRRCGIKTRRAFWLVFTELVTVLVSFVILAVSSSFAIDCCDEDVSMCSSCEDCPAERSGKECPPACPDCHHVHTVLGLPGPLARVQPGAPSSVREQIRLRPSEASGPRAPSIFGVYRPPRAAHVTT